MRRFFTAHLSNPTNPALLCPGLPAVCGVGAPAHLKSNLTLSCNDFSKRTYIGLKVSKQTPPKAVLCGVSLLVESQPIFNQSVHILSLTGGVSVRSIPKVEMEVWVRVEFTSYHLHASITSWQVLWSDQAQAPKSWNLGWTVCIERCQITHEDIYFLV